MRKILGFGVIALLAVTTLFAANPVVNLVISYKTVYFAGKPIKAMAINNQIPGPILHFKEGDKVTINVYNRMSEGTALHWHGLIVPWQMDGVEGVSQMAIPAGKTFQYKFILRQSGTYWYHAHAGLQEQSGLYGAFIIDPKNPPHYSYTKDYPIVLSDWINTKPEQVVINLKKTGDYYAPRFPLQPSLVKFLHDYRKADTKGRQQLVGDYKLMQKMRMSIYDISDVAYNTFLLNGHPPSNPWAVPVKKGDVVRLRFIGAGSGTIFKVKIPGTTMQMVHAEGNDVKPYAINELSVAPGETFDVLVKIKKNKPYIIYVESMDKVGKVYGVLMTQPHQLVHYKEVTPFPEPLPVTRDMMSLMMGKMHQGTLPASPSIKASGKPMAGMNMLMDHGKGKKMDMSMPMDGSKGMNMAMPIEPTIIGDAMAPPDNVYKTTIDIKYDPMKAAVPTNDPNKPIEAVINMELFGYMDQYIWFVNGVPAYKAKPIPLKPGKRYRFVFTNTSMMHHPMHIHGHWFILRKGQNAFDPLLNTMDVPPGSTLTADLDTEASGQWFFHCHMLYHMMNGMARVFQYTTLLKITNNEMKPQDIHKQGIYYNRPIVREDEVRPIDKQLVKHPQAHSAGFWVANFLDVGDDPFHDVQFLTYRGLFGPDYNKLELLTKDAEASRGGVTNADVDIFYWRLISQFWAIKGGVNYFNRPARFPYWQPGIGLEGLMPFFIDTDIRTYFYGGSVKFDIELSRDTQITNNFFIRTGVRSILATKTVVNADIGSGLNQMRYVVRPYYRLMPEVSVFVEYENEQDYGAFKTLDENTSPPSAANTVTFGLSFIF